MHRCMGMDSFQGQHHIVVAWRWQLVLHGLQTGCVAESHIDLDRNMMEKEKAKVKLFYL